ncbi:MAG TPA: hypothetical protein PLQ35_00730 [bacterium]|nr:hypothetical protein [bacterium]HQL60795.1 hypothetical protein [bacterium]
MKTKLVVGFGILAVLMIVTPGTQAQTAAELGFEAGVDAAGLPAGFPSSGVYGDATVKILQDASKARSGTGVLEIRAKAGGAANSQAYLIRQVDASSLGPDGAMLTVSVWFKVTGLDASSIAQVWIYQWSPEWALLDYTKGSTIGAAYNDAGWVRGFHTIKIGYDAKGLPFFPDATVGKIDMRPCHAYFSEDKNEDGKDAVVLLDDVTIATNLPTASSVEVDWALYE